MPHLMIEAYFILCFHSNFGATCSEWPSTQCLCFLSSHVSSTEPASFFSGLVLLVTLQESSLTSHVL